MPVTRPSDKDKDRTGWWKHSDKLPEQEHIPDPKNTPDVSAEMRETAFKESELPVEYPT